jgi:hypothetical protein
MDPGAIPMIPPATAAPNRELICTAHKERQIYDNHTNMDDALKAQVINTIQDPYNYEMQNTYTGYLDVPTRDLLDHLLDCYGKITPADITDRPPDHVGLQEIGTILTNLRILTPNTLAGQQSIHCLETIHPKQQYTIPIGTLHIFTDAMPPDVPYTPEKITLLQDYAARTPGSPCIFGIGLLLHKPLIHSIFYYAHHNKFESISIHYFRRQLRFQ